MTSVNAKKGINLIAIEIIDNIIDGMKELTLDQKSQEVMIEFLESKKKDKTICDKKKKKPGKKRVVLEKNQCGHINDESKRCGAPMCDKDLRRCWVHMNAEQKAAYRWKKAQKSV